MRPGFWGPVAASLVLHAVGLGWLSSKSPVHALAQPPVQIPVEMVWQDQVALPSANRAAARMLPAPASPSRANPTRASTVRAEPNRAEPSRASAKTGHAAAGPLHLDAPRGLATLPTSAALERAGVALPAPEPLHGHTVHPEDLPSAEELLADEEAHVAQVVDTQLRDELAKVRVEGGLVDPYYHDLRRQLTRALVDVPDFTDAKAPQNLPGTWANSWKGGAERYGKTGTAYAAPVTRESISGPGEIPSKLDPTAQGMSTLAMKLYAGARLRDFGAGQMGVELHAVVELQQAATGAIEGLRLVERSGVATFDSWVLGRASSAVEALGTLDAGSREQRRRSMWGFTGRVSYLRSTKDVTFERDWAYFAVAALTGLNTGTFDEVLGESHIVDLRNPHYECSVKLLRVYDAAP